MASIYLNTVYNHFLTSYTPNKSSDRYDAHKKSELRSIYTSIVKLNKESPWYLPNNTKETQSFAINLKENSRNLRNTIVSLGGVDDSTLLNRKIAFTSNEDIATVSYIGNAEGDDPVLIDLEVNTLATPQQNLGNFLPNEEIKLPAGSYSFDLQVQDLNYELQFKIQEGDSNQTIQKKLADLINHSNIGLEASTVIEEDLTSLKLQSTSTGIPINGETFFKVSDNKSTDDSGIVAYLGLDYISSLPQNASFNINGEEHSSASNHFQLGSSYELKLHHASNDQSIKIGLKADYDSLTENVNELLSGYNAFITSTTDGTENEQGKAKLLTGLNKITTAYQTNLQELGITRNETGILSFDRDMFEISCAASNNLEESLTSLKNFAGALLNKSAQISLDPMAYTTRTIAAYKNPGRSFSSPYITSSYSGMFFNSYC